MRLSAFGPATRERHSVVHAGDAMGGLHESLMLTGIQPSGPLMIGNYTGALKDWMELQAAHTSFLMIADLHAITVPQDPEVLRGRSFEFVALFAACGMDVETGAVFMQSHVPAHTQLMWLLNCVTPMGDLQRMTQFKNKVGRRSQDVHVGLFDYPVLMAADILLYRADLVPVGDDQRQHMEFTRRIARKFNSTYGAVFKIPVSYAPRTGARLMGLQDPTIKMSKSDPNPDNYVAMLDPPEVVRKKIRAAVTDSGSEVRSDELKPGISNLLALYAAVSGERTDSIEARYTGKGYAEFKEQLAERIIDFLDPIQKRYRSIASDRVWLNAILRRGADRARERSETTLARAYEAIGLVDGRPGDRGFDRLHRSTHGTSAEGPWIADTRALPERRHVMGTEETKELSTAATAETDADDECESDCCVCCCCDTEEECRMEA
jgi:tryptophanyl-tRNA synthetase